VVTNIVSSVVTCFVYDGDGHRVKSVLGGVTTYYVGAHFEWTTFGAVCQTPVQAR